MNENKTVCVCSSVEEAEVIEYLEKNGVPANDTEFETMCEELDVGQKCECCLDTDCDIIDINIKTIIKNKKS